MAAVSVATDPMVTQSEDDFYVENNTSQRAYGAKKRVGMVAVTALLVAGAFALAYKSHLATSADVSAVTEEVSRANNYRWDWRFTTAGIKQGEALSNLADEWAVTDYRFCGSDYTFFAANTANECATKCKETGCTQFSFHVKDDGQDGGCRLGTGSGGKCVPAKPTGTTYSDVCYQGYRVTVGTKMGDTKTLSSAEKRGWSQCTLLTYELFPYNEKKAGYSGTKSGWCSPWSGGSGDLCKEKPTLEACSSKDSSNYINECKGDFDCVSELCHGEPACAGFTQRDSDKKYKLKSKITGVIHHSRYKYKCFVKA